LELYGHYNEVGALGCSGSWKYAFSQSVEQVLVRIDWKNEVNAAARPDREPRGSCARPKNVLDKAGSKQESKFTP
jgi:hypothetical protein